MQNSSALSRMPRDTTSIAFLAVAFLTGIAGALYTPVLSLFLTDVIQVSPALVGLFFTGSAVSGIIISQLLAALSDRRGDRRTLILFCCLLGVLGYLMFVWNRQYALLLLVGVSLLSVGATANPQLFALAREHADRTGREAVMYSTFLRTQISLAWVVGPPLAFGLAMGYGFTILYLLAAAVYLLCAIIVWYYLPSHPQVVSTTLRGALEAPRQHRRDVLLLFVACTMMWGTNSLYLINMPLYIINELHLPDKLAGIMMGCAAGLEIPVMLIAGYYARRLGKRRLMLIALAGGLVFYLVMLQVHHRWLLVAAQLFNALYIGILAGIGMIYFQDLMPGQAGAATTLYANTTRAGWIIAGSAAGAIAEIWNYHSVFYLAFGMVVIASLCLLRIRDI